MLKKKINRYIVKAVAIILCGGIIFAGIFYIYSDIILKDNIITAEADDNPKEFKFTKRAVGEGTTIDAAYLWPDEVNASLIAVYRDGKAISDNRMMTVTSGSVYHFRGESDNSILYTEIYVGAIQSIDITAGESGTWYRLLPSSIRDHFEADGWTWETGWEYTGRAYLDTEHKRVMIKSNDFTAVLYGVGLYLDKENGYSEDAVFTKEGEKFKDTFGITDNLFASALEYYYSKGGELSNICPDIYTMVKDVVSGLDVVVNPITDNIQAENEAEEPSEPQSGPQLIKDLLEYANNQREQYGLSPLAWDSADDDNTIIRTQEIFKFMSQTRPDGSDAFSAYTDEVMCEIRLSDVYDMEMIYSCAESYFLMTDAVSFNCAVYNGVGILIFVW